MHRQKHRAENNAKRLTKSTLAFFLPFFGLIVFSLTTFYYSHSKANLKIIHSEETGRLKLQRQFIDADIDSVVTDLRFFAANPHIVGLVNADSLENQAQIQQIEKEFLQFSAAKQIYDQIRLLNRQGQEIVRVNLNSGHPEIVHKEKLQNKQGRYYFDDTLALGKDEIFISPLDLNIERGKVELPLKPMIRFGTPLVSEDGEKKGVLLFNYLGTKLLQRFTELSKTSRGMSFLLNRSGYYLYAENPEISWGFMFPDSPKKHNKLSIDYPDAWQQILTSSDGQFETPAGLFTFSTVYPLRVGAKSSTGSGYAQGHSSGSLYQEEYFWKLVSFIPKSTLYAYDHSLRIILMAFFLVMSGVLGLGSWKLAQAKYSREQAEEEIKNLRGIIPICMYCKEIRDDEGSWKQIEQYIADRSEAEFSHGICERCMQEKHGISRKNQG